MPSEEGTERCTERDVEREREVYVRERDLESEKVRQTGSQTETERTKRTNKGAADTRQK